MTIYSQGGTGEQATGPVRRTPCILVFLAWAVVGIPAGWGVSVTVRSSLKLFTAPPAAQAPATQPAATAPA